MQWVLSTILGLIIAWIILAFVGPKKTISYYTQAPVQAVPLSELDQIMEAVGLKPSRSPAPVSVAEIAIMDMVPAPSPSVADMAATPAPAASNEVSQLSGLFGLNTPATQQSAAPAPGPAPLF